MLVLARFPESGLPASFEDDAAALLVGLAERPGFGSGRLVRSTDEGGGWVLVLEWASVGDWRRAFSSFEVRLRAMELFALAVDETSAYEVLISVAPDGSVVLGVSDRTGQQRNTDPAARD